MSPRATSRRWPAPTIESHPKLYKQFYGQPSFTWGKTLGSAPDITQGNRNPLLGKVAGRRRPQDRPHRRGRLRLHRLGRAERPPAGRWSSPASTASTSGSRNRSRLMQWGFNAWQAKPLFKAGAKVGTAKVQLGSDSEVAAGRAARPRRDHSRRACCRRPDAMKIRYQGPVKAPIAKGQHIADLVVTTARHRRAGRCRWSPARRSSEAGFFGRALDRPQAAARNGVSERADASSASKAGRGSASRPSSTALAAGAARARDRRASSPASPAEAPAPRRSASCC